MRARSGGPGAHRAWSPAESEDDPHPANAQTTATATASARVTAPHCPQVGNTSGRSPRHNGTTKRHLGRRPMRRAVLIACALACTLPAQAAAAPNAKTGFTAKQPGEARLTLNALAPGTDWGTAGSESAVVRIELDGHYNQDVVLFEGARAFDYEVSLGPVERGRHTVTATFDREKSPAG